MTQSISIIGELPKTNTQMYEGGLIYLVTNRTPFRIICTALLVPELWAKSLPR